MNKKQETYSNEMKKINKSKQKLKENNHHEKSDPFYNSAEHIWKSHATFLCHFQPQAHQAELERTSKHLISTSAPTSVTFDLTNVTSDE